MNCSTCILVNFIETKIFIQHSPIVSFVAAILIKFVYFSWFTITTHRTHDHKSMCSIKKKRLETSSFYFDQDSLSSQQWLNRSIELYLLRRIAESRKRWNIVSCFVCLMISIFCRFYNNCCFQFVGGLYQYYHYLTVFV